ncbi:acetyltransferase (GNAT) family protein [Kribbella amoyensis]|uniref:Acetyltransferase (GNAT) family protein n=1 Tax=Kribbella amoyensis TaxID=996641 RepID=A0A561BKI0_9ACTN|nr:GNAT family N-acetyltransferase [Kribbella amoyensis]TWD79355.1 acetyltransferase (GNAT) family protein [Kribbella amoyensis]
MGIEVGPTTPERWADVRTVMGERGDPSRCFCQYFRLRGKAWNSATPENNRDALRDQVHGDERAPGVLATAPDGTPVGWCAVAPRAAYPRVLASPNWRGGDPEAWVITCFVVPVPHRRQGVAAHLVEGAVDFARDQGATVVEACAVDTARAGRVPSADLYRGPLSIYLDAGFEEIARTSPQWVLVRR